MAIDIQPPNLSGLTAIAGKSVPLNLSPTGALGLQALQQRQANDAALRANDLAIMQMRQQGQLGLLSNATQNRALDLQAQQQQQQGLLAQNQFNAAQQQNALQNQQAATATNMAQQQFDYNKLSDAQKLDLDNRRLAQETAKDQMTKLLAEKTQDIKNKGAFAAYSLISMSGAKTPEEAQQIRTEILKEAAANNYMTPEEVKAANQMPLSQFQNGIKYKLMQYGMTKEYKDMQEASKPQNQSGLTQVFDPNTGQLVYSSTATKPTQSQVQKDIIGASDNLNELKKMYDAVPDKFFGATALGQPVTKIREWAENIPLIGKAVGPSEEAKKSLESYSGLQGTSNMLSMNIIKQLSGVQYSDKQLEFMNQILPQFGPGTVKSEFKGRAENLLRFFDEVKKNREQLLKSGIPVGSPEYNDKMLSTMQSTVSNLTGGNSNDPLAAKKEYLKKKGYSTEEIDTYFKSGGK